MEGCEAAQLGAEGPALRNRRLRGEHHVRRPRSQGHPHAGRPGLRHHRAPLRRARHVERPAHREMRAAVAQDVHLVLVEPDAALLVVQEGVVLPTVPKTAHHVVELRRALVARRVVQVRVEAEVHRLVLGLAGDQVPPGPAAADVVDGQETPGEVVGFVVGGGAGRDQADARRDGGERRDGADRLDVRLAAVADVERLAAVQRAAAHHGGAVLEEHRIQLAPLRRARHVGQPAEIEVAFRDGVAVPPTRGMAARHAEEGAEPELPLSQGRRPAPARPGARRAACGCAPAWRPRRRTRPGPARPRPARGWDRARAKATAAAPGRG